jgi:hypothetical protein
MAFMAFCLSSFGQSNCDTTLINTYLNPAGYKRLYVPTQPCSMYYYSNVAMYGIDAHIQSANLGIPQLIINNAQENTDVNNALFNQGAYNISPEAWLGMTDSATNSGASPYHWRTFAGDTDLTYFNWTAGEPNNQAPSCKVFNSCLGCTLTDPYWCEWGEDCAVINASGEWLDITCEGQSVTHVCVLELNTCPVLIKPVDMPVCAGASVTVSARDSGGTAPYTYTWNPGNLTGQTVTITPTTTDTVTIQASDRFQCIVDSSFILTINPNVPVANAGPDIQLCPGAAGTLGAAPDPNYSYSWSPAVGLSSTVVSDPAVGYATNPGAGTLDIFYVLTATWGSCTNSDTVQVTLYPNINNNFTTSSTVLCGTGDELMVSYAGAISGTATYSWDFDSAAIVSGSGAGPYGLSWQTYGSKTITLSVTDHGCYDSAVSHVVTLYARPTAGISASGHILSANQGTAYEWLLNSQPIPGSNTNTITADTNGSYQVIVTDSIGCTDTSAAYVVTGVGIAGIVGINESRIYPNPNNGSFIIETANAIGGYLSITDLLGRVIYRHTITMDKQQVELPNVPAGEYYIAIHMQGQMYTSKLTVAKD